MPAVAQTYIPRLVDPLIEELLASFPADLVVGPRACGKTTTAARHARTVVRLDRSTRRFNMSLWRFRRVELCCAPTSSAVFRG